MYVKDEHCGTGSEIMKKKKAKEVFAQAPHHLDADGDLPGKKIKKKTPGVTKSTGNSNKAVSKRSSNNMVNERFEGKKTSIPNLQGNQLDVRSQEPNTRV